MTEETALETRMEELFDEFMSEYEMDTEGSINDMLFEFFAEGFIKAIEEMSGEEEDEQ